RPVRPARPARPHSHNLRRKTRHSTAPEYRAERPPSAPQLCILLELPPWRSCRFRQAKRCCTSAIRVPDHRNLCTARNHLVGLCSSRISLLFGFYPLLLPLNNAQHVEEHL